MSGRDEELLSAYIDGELSGDERSSVEQWLADDVAARELLDELTETSGWVRSLPSAAAPPELRDAVVARLRATGTVNSRPMPAARPNRRRLAGWVASSAAGLLLVFVLYRTWPSPAGPDVVGSSPPNTAPSVPDTEFGRTAMTDTPDSPEVAAFAIAAEPSASPAELAYQNSLVLQEQLAEALEGAETPIPGETLEQLVQFGDQVVIIQYRVIDTQDMFDHVQVLLSKNKIVAVNQEDADADLALLGDRKYDGQLQAIYVDAPQTNFTAAINEITNFDGVTAVTQNTVALADDIPARDSELLSDEYRLQSAEEAPQNQPGLLSRFQSGEVNSNGNLPTPAKTETDPIFAGSASKVAERGKPADAPEADVDGRSLSPVPAQTAGGESASPEPAQADFAYQVVVPARRELLLQLEQHEAEIAGAAANERSDPASGPPDSLKKQVRQQVFGLTNRRLQGPFAGDRVRAVILFIPDRSE